jgi:hypothetical protein
MSFDADDLANRILVAKNWLSAAQSQLDSLLVDMVLPDWGKLGATRSAISDMYVEYTRVAAVSISLTSRFNEIQMKSNKAGAALKGLQDEIDHQLAQNTKDVSSNYIKQGYAANERMMLASLSIGPIFQEVNKLQVICLSFDNDCKIMMSYIKIFNDFKNDARVAMSMLQFANQLKELT